jgi:hypothetical protein
MSWKSVDLELPKEGEYLCVIRFWKTIGTDHLHGYGQSMTTPIEIVTSCSFDPKRGWSNLLMQNIGFDVIHWMNMPESPKEESSLSNIFPKVLQ